MNTTFKVRRASDSHWVRQKENDWLSPLRSKSSESKIGLLSSPRSSFGLLEELLTCNLAALPDVGKDLIRWFDEQNNIQAPALDWLSYQMEAGRSINDHNRIAAMEILARYDHRSAPRLIDRYLSEPIREYHLYALPLARLPRIGQSQEAKSIAQRIVHLYRESKTIQPAARWRERFAVEAFRSLTDLSPSDVVGPLGSDLENVADLELTPILESVSLAARKLDRDVLSQSSLKVPLKAVWDRYNRDKSTKNLGNRPGIMGRLLELLGRVGADLAPFLASLDGHPLRMQVLYQFTRRPLDFAPTKARLRWYGDVLKSMIDSKQNFALKKFLIEVVVPDMPPEFLEKLMDAQTDRSTAH